MRTLLCLTLAAALACAKPATGVDVAWKVVPRRVAADTFGSRVAKLYFAVVVTVGNSSGHDLQVSSILFRLPESAGLGAPIPSDPYGLVRGTLQREHQVGLRNSSVSAIKVIGPLLAGASAFYPAPGFSRFVSLFTSPFEKGFEFVFPDKTIPQMAALDSLAMRESTIIANNTQQSLIVFISRDLLVTAENRSRLRKSRSEFEPQAVMRALGELVLTGKSIEYVNRITVTSAAPK